MKTGRYLIVQINFGNPGDYLNLQEVYAVGISGNKGDDTDLTSKVVASVALHNGPEHLHDPPFLKYIPHLWPGGGECGDRTEPGIFYDGNDLAWRNGVVAASDCAKQCAGEPQCHGWSHFAPAKRCYIKSSLTGPMVEFPGTESGPKPCKSKSKN